MEQLKSAQNSYSNKEIDYNFFFTSQQEKFEDPMVDHDFYQPSLNHSQQQFEDEAKISPINEPLAQKYLLKDLVYCLITHLIT